MAKVSEALIQRLKEAGLCTQRFLKLEVKGKAAVEKDWPDRLYEPEELEGWSGNVGGAAGGGLVLIDADDEPLANWLRQNLPETFTVLSPGHGKPHYYLKVADGEAENLVLYWGEDDRGNRKIVGHVQTHNKYLVAPGSIHPNGQPYRVLDDKPIAEIQWGSLLQILKPFLKESLEKVEETAKRTRKESGLDIDILRVVPLAGLKRRGDEYQGPHPVHGSTTGKPPHECTNFCVNPRKNVWHCFAHDSGGGPLEYLAVEEGLIRCEDAGRGALRGEVFKILLEKAVERGLISRDAVKSSSGNFSIGSYRLGLIGKDVFLYDSRGEPAFSCKLHDLNTEKNKTKIAKLTGLEKAEVERKVADFIFRARRKEWDESGDEESSNDAEEPKEEVFDEETKEKARLLLRDPAFFYKLGKVFEYGFCIPKVNKPRFVVEEERNKRLVGFLLIGAAKLGMTSLIKLLGEPSTAKDTILRMWLKLLPLKTVERSYFTAATLRYSEKLQEADLLYIPDSPELSGEKGRHLRFMRADDGGLISEYALKDKETGEMTTEVVTLPVKAVATTSNAVTGDTALESGMWTLHTNDSPELTRTVKAEKLKFRAGKRPLFPEDELKVWKCAFWLMLTEEPMQELPNVPFAENLANLLASERSESRRDPDKLCDLISLIAWARRFQKPKEKWADADWADLFIALQLGLDAITETISDLDVKEQQIFNCVKEGMPLIREGKETKTRDVTCRYVADQTGIPYKTCYRLLEKMIEKGFLNKDKRKGKNVYSVFREKEPKDFFIGVDISQNSPDKLLEQVLRFAGDFSPSHNPTEGGYNMIDPTTGQKLTVEFNDGKPVVKVEPCSIVYPPFQPYEKVRSVEIGEENVSNGEKKPDKQISQPIRSDLTFSKPNIQDLRLSEAPEGLSQCEFCARQGKRVFFATLEDLKGHIRAFHGGYPDVRKVTHELQS